MTWGVVLNDELQALHQKALLLLQQHTHARRLKRFDELMSQPIDDGLLQEIQKNGFFWMKEIYEPHITIFYNSQHYENHINDIQALPIPILSGRLSELGWGEIDEYGRVMRTIGESS